MKYGCGVFINSAFTLYQIHSHAVLRIVVADYLHKYFMIGENIFDNMGNAIVRSKRTVCVVTRNFIQSKFCMFEFGMAVNVDMLANRKRLIVIMQEDIEKDDLPEKLRNYVNSFTYLTRDCPFFMKRLTYRLAQNKLGEPDDVNIPLLASNNGQNYGSANDSSS